MFQSKSADSHFGNVRMQEIFDTYQDRTQEQWRSGDSKRRNGSGVG